MRRSSLLAICTVLVCGCAAEQQAPMPQPESAFATLAGDDAVRFRPLDIELAVAEAPVGAYQVELLVTDGDAQIVGVEGGTLPGFEEAPYYDPAALAGGRIVLAAFSTAETLPADGTHRVATVHLRETGSATTYELKLIVAADAAGEPVVARPQIGLGKGDGR